jgi:hypothetical protein
MQAVEERVTSEYKLNLSSRLFDKLLIIVVSEGALPLRMMTRQIFADILRTHFLSGNLADARGTRYTKSLKGR